jgi:hypothetical protein
MHCKQCGKNHEANHPHFKLVKKLNDKGFPEHPSKAKYEKAHRIANRKEKEKYGAKSFGELNKLDRGLGKHELSGKNTKSGKIEVSEKVKPKLRREVAYHEQVENRALRKKK